MSESIEQLSQQLGDVLTASGQVLAVAESCTGGWIAKILTDVPGSSGWFDRGFVTYSNLSKQEMLGVAEDTLLNQGAVSEATVREMAVGTLNNSRADCSAAVSGNAGPGGGSAEKPVGTVWFAWASKNGEIVSLSERFAGDREAVRRQSVEKAMSGILKLLAEAK